MTFEHYKLLDGSKIQRLKVPGGWLVEITGYRESSVCFYPDSQHEWVVDGWLDSHYHCPECGGSDLRKRTEFNRAACPTQFLIDDSLFCYNCQETDVQQRLDNPITNCRKCDTKNNTNCAASNLEADCSDDHTSVWGGAGPDCMPKLREAA